MMTLSNISTTNTLVSRPMLVADSVRPAAPSRSIEPTTAVSKERSQVETKVPEGVVVAASMRAASPSVVTQIKIRSTPVGDGNAMPTGTDSSSAAPSQKTQVQKALEEQINGLLGNIWEASSKAVNFLLGRQQPTAAQLATADNPMQAVFQNLMGQKPSIAASNAGNAPADTTTSSGRSYYSSSGSAASNLPASAGQLLDVLA